MQYTADTEPFEKQPLLIQTCQYLSLPRRPAVSTFWFWFFVCLFVRFSAKNCHLFQQLQHIFSNTSQAFPCLKGNNTVLPLA